jgi:hypothetical protein
VLVRDFERVGSEKLAKNRHYWGVGRVKKYLEAGLVPCTLNEGLHVSGSLFMWVVMEFSNEVLHVPVARKPSWTLSLIKSTTF